MMSMIIKKSNEVTVGNVMSYQVLARKWRPRSFDGMIGQETILRILTNAIEQKRIHHAYLFTGTRGVGKTTLARILAKCLNCESGITPNPCGICHICQAIDTGRFLDLYEVDAASRTKVEDTRELLDNVPYPPNQGRYKVYLIDEVHMLSNHSFNALLKTLEEPPPHVKFLLATTEPKRLPVTILSRCLQFHLKCITPEQITKHLQHICKTESISYEIKALERLAQAAQGSLRDALSLLDQAIAYGQGAVNQVEVQVMLGSIGQDELLPLLDALASQNGKQVFHVISQLAESAPDFQQLLEELISLFHKIALMQILPQHSGTEEAIEKFVQRFTPEEVQLYYQIALLGKRDLSFTPSPQQGFEMTMLRMLAFQPDSSSITSHSRLKSENLNSSLSSSEIPLSSPKEKSSRTSTPSPTALPNWRDLLPKLELTGMAYALASNCTLEYMKEGIVHLALSATHQPMLNQKLQDRIAEALNRYLQQSIQLEINITSAELATPIKQQKQEKEQRLANATQTILQDSRVKQFIEMYDATVEVSLLEDS